MNAQAALRVETNAAYLQAKQAWAQACQFDMVDPKGMFVAFSENNPYIHRHGELVREWQSLKASLVINA